MEVQEAPFQAQSIFNNHFCKIKSLSIWVTLIHHGNKKEEKTNGKLMGNCQVSQSMSIEPTCSRASSLERRRGRGWRRKISVPR